MVQHILITNESIDGKTIQTVNGRDLHASLGIRKDYSSWVKAQIERARLVLNKDYLITQKGVQFPSGIKHSIEHNFTVEAAKHIAMMSGTDKGFEVRDYFLECERVAIAAPVKTDPLDKLPPEHRALIAMMVQNAELKATQEKQATDIARIEESVAVIEARSQPENKHFTVLGYSNKIGQKIDFKLASSLGRKCANLSREQGIHIGDVSDPRFGNVHSYHESILKQVLKAA